VNFYRVFHRIIPRKAAEIADLSARRDSSKSPRWTRR